MTDPMKLIGRLKDRRQTVRRSRLFYRYLASYIMIIIIPLMCLGIFGYYNYLTGIGAQNREEFTAEIDGIAGNINDLYYDLQAIAVRMHGNLELSRFLIADNPLGAKTAKEELTKYKSANSAIADIWLYYCALPGRIYAASGSWGYDLSHDVSGLSERFDIAMLADDYNLPVVLSADGLTLNGYSLDDYLLYIYSVDDGSDFVNGSITFFINKDAYLSPLMQLVSGYDGAAVVYDGQGNMLAVLDGGAELTASQIGEAMEGGAEGYTFFQSREMNAVSIAVMVNTGLFTLQERQSMKYMLLVILLVCAICMGVALFFSALNYNPLHNIVRSLEKRTACAPADGLNEIEVIRTTLNRMADENNRMQSSSRLLDKHILRDILLDHVRARESDFIDEHLASLRSRLWVAVFDPPKDEPPRDLLHVEHEGMAADILEIEEYGHMAMVIGTDGDRGREEVEILLAFVHKNVMAYRYLGVGTMVTDHGDMARSYIEAVAAFNLSRSSRQKNTVFFANMEPREQSARWYPFYEESRLEQSLKMGNEKLALESVDNLMDYADALMPDRVKRKCIDGGMTGILVREMSKLNIDYDLFAQRMSDPFRQGRREFVEEACRWICAKVRESMVDHAGEEQDEMIAYIREHFCDNMLSMERLCDQFNRSESYVSRVIKEKCKMTFGDLVWNLRFEEIKRQLIETDKPIRQIVCDVGYIDVSNLTRKFRKNTGITPNAYRSLNRG